jgi:pyridoxal phosphate enzyme (YggS family)
MLDKLAADELANALLDRAELAARLASIKERIRIAAERAGRDPASVALVAVSKTQSTLAVAALATSGQLDFGENRIEEAEPKMLSLRGDTRLRWHMVGHVQSRKARDVVRAEFVLVHSVDSLRLAERLSRLAQEAGRHQAVLLECNVSGESNKAGFRASEPGAWPALLPEFTKITTLPGLEVCGLMTMAPQVPRAELARPYFQRLAALRDFLKLRLPGQDLPELSMGMTDDFEPAIEAGATLVRIGRAIFGERA